MTLFVSLCATVLVGAIVVEFNDDESGDDEHIVRWERLRKIFRQGGT